MAAAIANKSLSNVAAESAGVDAYDEAVAENAVEALKSVGINISGHRSRHTSKVDLGAFQIIVALDPLVGRCLRARHGELQLMIWNVKDPYKGGAAEYEAARDSIRGYMKDLEQEVVRRMANQIKETGN
jgi:protein-tyrosine-phosphatase